VDLYLTACVSFVKSFSILAQPSLEYHRHKYSGISFDDLRERIARFQQVLGDNGELNLKQIYAKNFRISV